MKYRYSQSYVNKLSKPDVFMNNRRDKLTEKYGGKWVWYPAHGNLVLLPIIDFKAYYNTRYDGADISDIRYIYGAADIVETLLVKPKTLINLFKQTDLSIPVISFACAYLIKEKGYKFKVCRTGDAVVIKKGRK